MKKMDIVTGLAIAAAAIVLGFALPRLWNTRLDAREIKCANNLKSIAAAALKYRAQFNHPPQSLADLEASGLTCGETNCPAAPPDYAFDAASTNLVVCPNHRVHKDGTLYRVKRNLEVHTSGNP
jgi:hypothetical protein